MEGGEGRVTRESLDAADHMIEKLTEIEKRLTAVSDLNIALQEDGPCWCGYMADHTIKKLAEIERGLTSIADLQKRVDLT